MDKENLYGRSRLFYVIEAALEYLIAILVSGSFLATITKEMGISDSLTGIISSISSLGCVFQLFSVFLRRGRVKPFVIVCSIVNQLLFLTLYIIPLSDGNKLIREALFVAVIFVAYIIYNIANPKKMNWFMSLVDDGNRGRFTATKEIVSLIAGMLFSFAMGALVDYYREAGRIGAAFILCAVTMAVLTLLHTATMLFSVEKPMYTKKSSTPGISAVIKDKNVIRVTVLFVIWSIASYSALPFYGTYQINELGFSLKFISVLSICYGVVRVLVSRRWGAYADRNSFASMIKFCFIIMAVGFVFGIFAVPSNGAVMFVIFNICYGIALGGINSALINLIFDYVIPEKRADSFALCQAVSGICGFLSTLAASRLVTYIQQNGNTLFGIHIYAQQAVSVVALVLTIAAALYVQLVIMKVQKAK